jgi:hypothetical protein
MNTQCHTVLGTLNTRFDTVLGILNTQCLTLLDTLNTEFRNQVTPTCCLSPWSQYYSDIRHCIYHLREVIKNHVHNAITLKLSENSTVKYALLPGKNVTND